MCWFVCGSASKKKAAAEAADDADSDEYDDFGRKKKKFRAKGVKVYVMNPSHHIASRAMIDLSTRGCAACQVLSLS